MLVFLGGLHSYLSGFFPDRSVIEMADGKPLTELYLIRITLAIAIQKLQVLQFIQKCDMKVFCIFCELPSLTPS